MITDLHALTSQMFFMGAWELAAVVLALFYLLLAMRESQWCWPAAFISTLIYTAIFWHVALLMESVLNAYYMGMAIFGYYSWNTTGTEKLPIVRWSLKRHIALIIFTTSVALTLGYLMARFTHADWPYLDAFTTCFSIITTALVTKKVLANWLYWVVIDIVSIFLYLNKGLLLTSLLFTFYTVLAIQGYLAWRRTYENTAITRAHQCQSC